MSRKPVICVSARDTPDRLTYSMKATREHLLLVNLSFAAAMTGCKIYYASWLQPRQWWRWAPWTAVTQAVDFSPRGAPQGVLTIKRTPVKRVRVKVKKKKKDELWICILKHLQHESYREVRRRACAGSVVTCVCVHPAVESISITACVREQSCYIFNLEHLRGRYHLSFNAASTPLCIITTASCHFAK